MNLPLIYNFTKAMSDGIRGTLRLWASVDPGTRSFAGLVGCLSCSQSVSSTPPSAQIVAELLPLEVDQVLDVLIFPTSV